MNGRAVQAGHTVALEAVCGSAYPSSPHPHPVARSTRAVLFPRPAQGDRVLLEGVYLFRLHVPTASVRSGRTL